MTKDEKIEELTKNREKYLEERLSLFPKVGTKLRRKKVLPEFYYPHYTDVVEFTKENLKEDVEYTVSKCEVYSSWCAVWLEEFPEGDTLFNLSSFDYTGCN